MKKLGVLLCISLVLMISCISTGSERLSDRPYWIDHQVKIEGKVCYHGFGEAVKSQDAVFNACKFALQVFMKERGNGDVSVLADELARTSEAENGRFKLEYQYMEQGRDGSWEAYVLMSVTDTYDKQSRDEYKEAVASCEAKVQELINSSDAAYRQNNDYQAIVDLLDAYMLARKGPIGEAAFSLQVLLDRAIKMIGNLSVSIKDLERSKATCTIRVRRNSGFIHPNVVGAKFFVTYRAFNAVNASYTASYSFVTQKDGQFHLSIPNRQLTASGIMTVRLDLTQQLEKLKEAGYMDAYDQVEAANHGRIISYDKQILLNGKKLALDTLANDATQNPLDTSGMDNILSSFLLSCDNSVYTLAIKQDDVDEILAQAKLHGCEYAVLCKAEIVDEQMGTDASALVSGSVELYRVSDGNKLFVSDLQQFCANGQDQAEARKKAFAGIANRLCAVLLSST